MYIPFGVFSAGGGDGNSFELITTSLISSPVASVTFDVTGLGSTYKHLQLRITAKDAYTGAAASDFYMALNGAGTGYKDHYLSGNGTSAASGSFGYTTVIEQGDMVSNSAGNTSIFGAYVIDILDAFSTSKNKTTRTLTGYNASGRTQIYLASGAWFSTSAITTINLRSNSNIIAGSRFSLYGIKG